MHEVVFDCCVISNFALAGALRTIRGLYPGSAFITAFVSAEVLRGIQAGHDGLTAIPAAVQDGWLKETDLISPDEKKLFESLSVSLGFGEASSLAVARKRGYRLASDDEAARREARALGIALTGTIGILKKAVKLRICDQDTAERYLAKMIASGFYSPVKSLF